MGGIGTPMVKCSLCDRQLEDSEVVWRNPLALSGKDADGFLQLSNIESDRTDPAAAPYCHECIERLRDDES